MKITKAVLLEKIGFLNWTKVPEDILRQAFRPSDPPTTNVYLSPDAERVDLLWGIRGETHRERVDYSKIESYYDFLEFLENEVGAGWSDCAPTPVHETVRDFGGELVPWPFGRVPSAPHSSFFLNFLYTHSCGRR